MPYPNWIFSLFSGIGFVLCCIPFPWHVKAWNTGTCLVMAWSGFACLGLCINSIIWKGNTTDWAPVWCDIFTRFLYGFNLGISAASLCINRRLYLIVSVRKVTISRTEKCREIVIDLAIGLGIPIISIILYGIHQTRRFLILEDVGCFYDTYTTWVEVVLFYVPCIVTGLAAGTYAILSICAFFRVRAQSNEILSLHSSLSSSLYIRLMALGTTEVISSVPINIFSMISTVREGLVPWTSWDDIHADVSHVLEYPAQVWHYHYSQTEMSRWICVACAFVFFAYFGFADEATKRYSSAIRSVGRIVGVATESFGSSSSMSTGGVGLHLGSISKEKIIHKESSFSNIKDSGSLNTSSTPTVKRKKWAFLTTILSSKKKFNEGVFKSNFQYSDLVLPDIGRIPPGYSSDNVLTIPFSVSSDTPNTSSLKSSVIFQEAVNVPASVSVDPHTHSHDIV